MEQENVTPKQSVTLKQWANDWVRPPLRYLLSWRWVKHFLYWAIISGGTISECAFLLASIWMSINSSVHPMVLSLMTEKQSANLSYIATTIFTALPELILSLALITTINHCRNIQRGKEYWYTWVWAILFGIPSLVFLFLSIMTISYSVQSVNYTMAPSGVVARALAGYMFAIVFLIYEKIGEPCYASNRKKLENALAQKQEAMDEALTKKQEEIEKITARFEDALKTANSNFKVALESKQNEFEYRLNSVMGQSKVTIESLQNLIETQNTQVQKLSEKASSLIANGIENYPKVLSELIDRDVKTVTPERLSELTGISKRKITSAKSLQRHGRNRDLIMVSSVVEWLKNQPLPEQSNDQLDDHNTYSNGHLKGNTDPLELPLLSLQ